MSDEDKDGVGLPAKAGEFAREEPAVWTAYAALGKACSDAGPLDKSMQRLLKLALAIGADSEGAVHSHTRRALSEGHSPEALRHVAVLAIPTAGFPAAIRALTWIEDVLNAR
jgi:alkylhydroperoxidase/carboxymuconolactone decarboxylase family protein YurZ